MEILDAQIPSPTPRRNKVFILWRNEAREPLDLDTLWRDEAG